MTPNWRELPIPWKLDSEDRWTEMARNGNYAIGVEIKQKQQPKFSMYIMN